MNKFMSSWNNPWVYPREKARHVRDTLIINNKNRVRRLMRTTDFDLIQLLDPSIYPAGSKSLEIVEQILDKLNSQYPKERLENKRIYK